jgi:nucleotide-binding universal stress UspA family protein
MFTKILFATSGSPCCDAAARVAFDLATRHNAKLFICHVLGVPSRGFSQVVVDVRTGEKVELDEDYTLWVQDELKNTYDRQLKSGVDCEIGTAVGIPHREILRKARQEDVDLIVMGASTTGCEADAEAYQRHFAGSTLQRVAKASKAPVLVVNRPVASFWGGFTNIVFGADFSKASEHAFKFALKTAKELDAKLHAQPHFPEGTRRQDARGQGQDAQEISHSDRGFQERVRRHLGGHPLCRNRQVRAREAGRPDHHGPSFQGRERGRFRLRPHPGAGAASRHVPGGFGQPAG